MRVLMLSRFPDRASGHFRFYQYLPYLAAHDVQIEAAPLFGNHYLNAILDGGQRSFLKIAADYGRRLLRMVTAGKYDLLWVHFEALPYMPASFEALLTPRGIPYVVDYDDAWFHRYQLHASTVVRRLLGEKINWVMRRATLVIAGNSYIEQYARRAGARWVERLPTVVNFAEYCPWIAPPNNVFTIGWLGSQTVAVSLAENSFRTALGRFCADHPTRFVVIGAQPPEFPGVDVEVRKWSRQEEVRELMGFDVGVAPLVDSPFEWGKCGLKLIQYMAAGRPVVASPIGCNRELVDHGRNGFLASTASEWLHALEVLWRDPALRERLGRCARTTVEQKYSLAITTAKLANLLRRAARQTLKKEVQHSAILPAASGLDSNRPLNGFDSPIAPSGE
jgi:glycosyltransferase involved in cell wall biosynthesis